VARRRAVGNGEHAGKPPVVTRHPVPQGDVDATFADVSRAKEELGWSPRVPLREGLATVVEWVKANP